MPEQPKHPDAQDLPHPTERHGGEHGIPSQVSDDQPTGNPTSDRHETEVAPAKPQAGPHFGT